MKNLEKISIGLLFTLLFFVFVSLSTVTFLILNEKYLFYVFEKHNIYERIPRELGPSLVNDPDLTDEEKLAFGIIISSIPPQTVEKILKTNTSGIIGFTKGANDDLILSLPVRELQLGPQDIKWSLSENAPTEIKKDLMTLKGAWLKLLVLLIAVVLSIVGLFFVYGKIAKDKLAGRRLLIINGALLYVAGLFLYVPPQLMSQTLPTKIEPSQAILKLLFTSLIPEIALLWIVVATIVFALGLVLIWLKKREVQPL